ncbi:helix-turn-helix domain-containing protein [Mucilaginibacter conchicola]|uniref:helix-turn-helix domain-containing protein n=1 Tax=Mucilaginibacter conchicola TaxID=2303333 RepID=UPI0037439E0B
MRVRKNISQSDVAEVLGISQNAYSKLERGHTRLQMETIFLIIKVLNVPLMQLIDITIPESSK